MELKGPYKAGCKIRWFGGLSGSPGKCQKEGQEHQGTLKQLGRSPKALLSLPGPPGLPSGSPLGSPTIHQATLYYSLFKGILASLRIQSELCLLFGSSLGSLTIHHTTSSYSLFIGIAVSFGRVRYRMVSASGRFRGWRGMGG